MDSTHLLYFKAIAESDSLTKAAQALHVSQPALSKNLANLERELGCSLFNRIGGRLYLNKDGKALLEYANQVDYIFNQIERRFAPHVEAPAGLSLYSIGNYFPFVMKHYFQYDTRPLQLHLVPNAQIAEAVFSGDADIAIADDRYLQPNPEIGLLKTPILSEQLFLMVPKNHVLSNRKQIDITELAAYPIMRLNTNYWLEEIISANHVDLNLSWSVDSETWSYYWNNSFTEMPLCFDTSASFITQDMIKARKRRCNIVVVSGPGTTRMLNLWYFEKNTEKLANFLSCVKTSFM